MKWKLYVWIAVGILSVQACNSISLPGLTQQPGGETAAGPTATPFVAGTVVPDSSGETPMPGETAAVAPTGEMPSDGTGVPFSYQNISFVIPAGLGTGANPQDMPAVGTEAAPWEIAPPYTKIILTGYPLQGTLFEPQILVYPVAEFEASEHPSAAQILDRLRVLLGESDVPTNDEVPGVPMFNAAKPFGTQIARINMQNGAGIRLVTEYAQGVTPISNQELIYQFQGLTSDGRYYVIANLPVNASFLAGDENPGAALPADGIPFPDLNSADADQINAYVQSVAERLNTAGPDSFQPTLAQLDALIQSIQVAQ